MNFIMLLVFMILIRVPVSLLGGFIWMISFGALANIFDMQNLAIGYWNSVLVFFIITALFSLGRSK